MKIGIILSRCHKFGSSRYVIETVPYFAKKGHEIHIFANSWDNIDSPNVFFHKTPRVFSNNLFFRESFNTIMHTVIQKFQKFDVTVSQPTRYFTPDIGEMQFVYKSWINYKKSRGIKDSQKIKFSDSWLSWMEKRNVKRCKEFIVLAKCVKKDVLEGYEIPENKINVCYSGVNLDEFNPKNKKLYREEVRKKFGIGEDETLMLFVGNPFSRKGLDCLIKALSSMKDRKFKLLVSGKDDPTAYISLSKKLGLENKIVYNLGLTSEIRKIFAASDMFVFPTLYEPFGLVILEAMASGLPVITSEIAGAAELIRDHRDGIILKNPEEVKELEKSMLYFLDNPRELKIMGLNSRETSEKYSWLESAKHRLKVIERVAASK